MIFANLRRTLLLTNVLVMAAILIALGAAVLLVMDRVLVGQEAATVERDSQRAVVERGELSQDEFRSRHTAYTSGTFYLVWDGSGNVLFNPSGAPSAPLAAAAAAARAGHAATVQVDLQPGQPALISSRLLNDDGKITGVLQAGRSLVPVRSVERQAILVALAAGLAALLAIILAGWFLTERALVPIRAAMDRQVRFTADASHELRTPLTIIDTGLQVLRRHPRQNLDDNRQVLESMSAETRRMTRLVDDLLALARVDSGQAQVQLLPTDVSELVTSTGLDLEALAAGRGGRVDFAAAGGIEALVDADRIRQLIVILVDNALRHGAPGDTIEVRAARSGNELRLEVADHGPGIPADQRPKVFEPFHRLEASRSDAGSGLGLSIAQWIVRSHRGTIRLMDNSPGLRVRVSIPLGSRGGQLPGRQVGAGGAIEPGELGVEPAPTT